jgi:hypothetical protein
MVKRKQKGGKITQGIHHNASPIEAPPNPELYTLPPGASNARQASMLNQTKMNAMQTDLINHKHTIHNQNGGACDGSPIPLAPTFNVKSAGPNGPTSQTISNYNAACQASANRVYDSQVVLPTQTQNGGKRKKRTHKNHKRRYTTKRTRTRKNTNKRKTMHKRRYTKKRNTQRRRK